MTERETFGLYYDVNGAEIDFHRWVELKSLRYASAGGVTSLEEDPSRIGSDHVGDAWVSTVWVGIDMGWARTTPIIFETMVFGGVNDQYQERYATKEAALAGHDRIVAAERDGKELDA